MQESTRPASGKATTTGSTAEVAAKMPAPQDAPATADQKHEHNSAAPGAAHSQSLTLRGWLRLAHAPYLILSVAPVLVAAAWLWSQGVRIAVGPLLLTGLGAALALAGAQLLDARMGRTPSERIVQDAAVLRAAIVLLSLGALLGVPLALAGGTPVLLVGCAALVLAVGYSATPYALKRLPVGELAVGLVCGPGVVTLTVLAQRQPMTPFALALGAGLGLFAAALVETANLRARAAGTGTDRYTLARLLGPRGGRMVYVATIAAAYLVVLAAAAWHGEPHGALAVLFSLPVAILPLTGVLRARAVALAPVVTGTLRAYAYFAFWLIIGLLLGALYLHLLRLIGS